MNAYPQLSPHGTGQFGNQAHPSPGGMSANAAAFQPGMTPRGSFGEQGGNRSNGQAQYQLVSPNLSGAMSMARGQRAPAPTGLSLNAAAPAFQMGGVGNAGHAMLNSPGGLSPNIARLKPVSPMISGGASPMSRTFSSASFGSQPMAVSPGGSDTGSTASPFAQAAAAAGPGWGVNGNRQARRGRGPPPVNQPIRTTGHNSTPSVSLNPAAFAAALAAQKPKRKVAVRLPTEIEVDSAENVFRHTISEENAQDDHGAIQIRQSWKRREPLRDVDVNNVGEIMPDEHMTSRTSYPVESDQAHGLPDFVDIFLPGRSAWDELREVFAQERHDRERKDRKKKEQTVVLEGDIEHGWGLGAGGGDGGAFGVLTEAKRSEKERTRLNDDIVPPIPEFSTPKKASHGQTMSLSIPQSGGAFGPAVLTALGLPSPSDMMERSYSDSEDRGEPALGARPRGDRMNSDPNPRGTPTRRPPSKDVSWRDLGRGFGYDLVEADEENLSDKEGSITQTPGNARHFDTIDVASNTSEDADASDLDDDEGDDPGWLNQRRRISDMHVDTSDALASNGITAAEELESISEEFSNPSDEEAARVQRRLQRAGKRAAVEAGTGDRESLLQSGNRPRAGTAETFASSSLGEAWNPVEADAQANVLQPEGVNIMSRGPLDTGVRTGYMAAHGTGHDSSVGTNTLSRAGGSTFRANAPSFTPNDHNTTHFRLPSIQNSSFGESFANADNSKRASVFNTSLNAAAPTFVPSAFTFTAPGNAPKLPQIPSLEPVIRESQGREKRFRHQDAMTGTGGEIAIDSPPRPKPSAASVESALRGDASGKGSTAAPPFNMHRSESGLSATANVFEVPPQPTLGAFSFQPTALPFRPTIGRPANTARAGMPSFEPPEDSAVQPPVSDFTFSLPQPKPVVIRRPDEASTVLQEHRPSVQPMNTPGFSLTHQPQPRSMVTNSSVDAHLSPREHPLLRKRASDPLEVASDDDVGDAESDDGTVSDIIEELGERMDRALEGWAGKILDEVTIMGQVRPVNMVTLDALERKTLVEAVGREVGDLLADYNDRLQDRLIELVGIMPQRTIEAGGDISLMSADDSNVSGIKETAKALTGSMPAATISGHPPLNDEGELQFDFVQEVLDQKISNLQRDLQAAFHTAIPRAMENVSDQIRDTIDAARLEAALKKMEDAPVQIREISTSVDSASTPRTTDPPARIELTAESSDTIASLLIGRLQPVFDEVAQQVTRNRRAEINEAIEPLLEDYFAQTKARGQAERQDTLQILSDALDSRRGEWERTLAEIKDATGDQLQAMVVKSIVPHLETLRPDTNVDADLIVARVAEILVPLISRNQRDDDGTQAASVTISGDKLDIGNLSAAIVDQLRPLLQHTRADSQEASRSLFDVSEAYPETLAEHVAELIKMQSSSASQSEGLDLQAVIAFLEPLVEKQDETRSLSRKTLEKQQEIEMSLNALPSAVNAKMEVIMATNQSIHDGHSAITKKLDELVSLRESLANMSRSSEIDNENSFVPPSRLAEVEERRETLLRELEEARKEATEAKAELSGVRSELSISLGRTSTLEKEVSRWEARFEDLERNAASAAEETAQLRHAYQQATEARHAAERERDEWQGKTMEFEAQARSQGEHHQTLQKHIEQMHLELNASRGERARERESAAQAAAETMMRAERAEEALRTERSRTETLLDQMRSAESDATQQTGEALQRAAKAEGEVAGLEKRIGDQDNKIANLQQLTATQKQKAAQSGQKLAEVEKRLREMEASDRELHVARARMGEMEVRLAEREDVEMRLRASMDAEARLRDELSAYQARFLDMERDLMSMRETLVGRDELEQSQADLTSAREEIAELRGQLAERDRREQEQKAQQQKQEQRLQEQQRQLHQQQQLALAVSARGPHVNGEVKDPASSVPAWITRSPSHGSSTWASIYAPNSSNEDLDRTHRSSFLDNSFDSPQQRDVSHIRSSVSTVSNSRAVECSVDGWWS